MLSRQTGQDSCRQDCMGGVSGDTDIMENTSEDKAGDDQNSFAIEQFDIVKTVGTGDEITTKKWI